MREQRLTQHKKEGVMAMGLAMLLGVSVSILGLSFTTPQSAHQHAVLGETSSSQLASLEIRTVQTYVVDATTQLQRASVTVSVTNNSDSVLQLAPGLQMQLVDSNGMSHAVTAAYQPAGTIIGGPVPSGATWTQAIDFELPVGATPASFVYQVEGASAPISVGIP